MKINPEIKSFGYLNLLVLISSFIIILFYLLFVYIDNEFYYQDFCLKTNCIKIFFGAFDNFYELIDTLTKLIVTTATALGVYYALMNYLSSSSTSNANVYLQHLNMFRTYIFDESTKDSRISIKSLNIVKWYNLAFPKSLEGDLSLGETYRVKIKEIINTVNYSNEILKGNSPEKFDYNKHQSNMINAFEDIGIQVQRLPKNDFFEIENCLINLINNVNVEICQETSENFRISPTRFK